MNLAAEEPNLIGDWRKVSILGSGGFGVVTLWRNQTTNDTLAIKKCRWSIPDQIPLKQRERWSNEVEIMRSIQHDNIVIFKELPKLLANELVKYNHSRLPLLSMEYCAKGNLRHCLNLPENVCGLPEIQVRYILADISSAVAYLHGKKITHRDLKPENIVLQKSDLRPTQTIYKLIDLGYAKELNSVVGSFVGTLHYLAPEIFLNDSYNCNVDYWSFGILTYEIVCGIHPFLPNLPPVQRFEHICRKGNDDICIYATRDTIKYSTKIISENHISPPLKDHLERWLRLVLRYKSEERGVTGNDKDVFQQLQEILSKNIICVFSVYNYGYYYYEVDESTLLQTLQAWIERDTGTFIGDQLLITDNMYYDDNANRTVFQCFDELNINTLIVLFKKGEFVKDTDVKLPPFVKKLLTNTQPFTWDILYKQTAHAAHYIHQETKLMKSFKKGFEIEYDYLQNLLKKETALFQTLQSTTNRLLVEIEFCKNMNIGLKNVCLQNELNVERVKTYRKHLRQSKEVIENVNAAVARHGKLRSKNNMLKMSTDTILEDFDKNDPDKYYKDALDCMKINKQKGAILTSHDIVKIVSGILKTRNSLVRNEFIKNHLSASTRMFKEICKLLKWMKALQDQIELLSVEISTNHVDMLKNINKKPAINYDSIDGLEYLHMDTEDLINENMSLRYETQELLNSLFITHEDLITQINSIFIDNKGTPV